MIVCICKAFPDTLSPDALSLLFVHVDISSSVEGIEFVYERFPLPKKAPLELITSWLKS